MPTPKKKAIKKKKAVNETASPESAFAELGLEETIRQLCDEIQELYSHDQVPWVIGYSGGKDSTAILQLVWMALRGLPAESRTKPVYVISTDTLVENPVVAAWVNRSLQVMEKAAEQENLPIEPNRLTPTLNDSFWVNLIGRGYPAPRHKFRWCTSRLKINPSNNFIRDVVKSNGEAILVLGTRKNESSTRAHNMKKHEKYRVRDRLSPNANLPNCLVYSPIEDWFNDDVWTFLMQKPNPWGYKNKDLLTMYQGATADGECPLVVDSTTPSCGNSRFGCWVCTMVEQDKSMAAMIQNDEEKEWMTPLLELRNELDPRNTHLPAEFKTPLQESGDEEQRNSMDKHLRDFRRLSGKVQVFLRKAQKDQTTSTDLDEEEASDPSDEDQTKELDLVRGPYKQEVRAYWLRRVLEAQGQVREIGPSNVRDIELISMDELHEIRRMWVIDKHEIEDLLPAIYEEAVGLPFPGHKLDDNQVFGAKEMEILKEVCGEKPLLYELVRELLDVEFRHRTQLNRRGLFASIESAFQRSYFKDENEATQRAKDKKRRNQALQGSNNDLRDKFAKLSEENFHLPLFDTLPASTEESTSNRKETP